MNSQSSPRTGMLLTMAAITMIFAALTSALFVRQGAAKDWLLIVVPRTLEISMVVLIVSCGCLWWASRAVPGSMQEQKPKAAASIALILTVVLGAAFLAGEWLTVDQVRSHGATLASGPAASFFYVFVFLHALLVLCGWLALARAVVQFSFEPPRLKRSTFEAAKLFWYFMGAMSIYLMLLMRLKIA